MDVLYIIIKQLQNRKNKNLLETLRQNSYVWVE